MQWAEFAPRPPKYPGPVILHGKDFTDMIKDLDIERVSWILQVRHTFLYCINQTYLKCNNKWPFKRKAEGDLIKKKKDEKVV